MSFSQLKFMGATVYGYRESGGWNEQVSQVSIQLVEDPNSGDDFILKEGNVQNYNGALVGTPFSFTHSSFRFDGILSTFSQIDSFNGHPTYDVILTQPTALLEGTQVILTGYVGPTNDSVFNSIISSSGATFQITNLLNVYGYLEDGGANFGNAMENEGGLLWEGNQGVKHALTVLTSSSPSGATTTNFGSMLAYRGHTYELDLTNLPTAPTFYRIGGATFMTLLDVISSICQDGGVDYMVKMTKNSGNGPHTIGFRTIDRVLPSTLGQIGNFINGQSDLNNSNRGQELRNDLTQVFIVGGNVEVLQPLENWTSTNPFVMPFWGFDINGNPILGQKPDGTFFADDDHIMNLNASAIADIMGALSLGLSYTTNILELRCALRDYDSWAGYLSIYKPDIATALGLVGAVKYDDSGFVQKFVQDFIDDRIETAKQFGFVNESQNWTTVFQRFYEWIRNQAETFYGKQFLVQIPYEVKVKIIPDEVATLYSHEPSDGGFLPEGSSPLGLNYINENFFLDPQGRFTPFLRFQGNAQFKSAATITGFDNGSLPQDYKIVTANPSILDDSLIIQPNSDPSYTYLYLKNYDILDGPTLVNGLISGGGKIFFAVIPGQIVPVPCMIISISSPVFTQGTDPLGGIDDIATMLNVTQENLLLAATFRASSFPMKIHPPAIYPNGVAVAIRSNQFTYGPWGKSRADGKVAFEQDSTLVPWEYGGYGTMNQAAIAKLNNIATGNQVLERGFFEKAGEPQYSIGDLLYAGGPVVTNIDVNIGTQGVNTEYRMETFVPRVGVFIRENADRLKRFGKAYQQLRKSIRQLFIERNKTQSIINSYGRGFMYGTSYAIRQETPHAVLGGHLYTDSDLAGKSYPLVYTQTFQESIANVQAQNDDYYRVTACMSFDGLLRPLSTNPWASGISSFRSSQDEFVTGPTVSSLMPLQSVNDFMWYSSGDTYSGLNNRSSSGDITNARLIGLRGPMLLSGWGFDIFGNPVPNLSASGTDPVQNWDKDNFPPNYLVNSQNFPSGPIDLRWNKFSAVWQAPGIILGEISGSPLSPGGTTDMIIMNAAGQKINETAKISNFFLHGSLSVGKRVIGILSTFDNKVIAIAGDCDA